jgi:hypothetical protein
MEVIDERYEELDKTSDNKKDKFFDYVCMLVLSGTNDKIKF